MRYFYVNRWRVRVQHISALSHIYRVNRTEDYGIGYAERVSTRRALGIESAFVWYAFDVKLMGGSSVSGCYPSIDTARAVHNALTQAMDGLWDNE